jgi:formamidopyrimidine-DNA glycosylase
MPELPEVENIAIFLRPTYVGKKVANIIVLNPKQSRGMTSLAHDKKILDITRHGKVLLFHLDLGIYIGIHLKMSGALSYKESQHTRVILSFDQAQSLFFNDPRKFGWLEVSKNIHTPKGVDCMSSQFTHEYFQKHIRTSRKNIKVALLDQTVFAGIGNIYANDALWLAKISPLKICKEIDYHRIKKLYEAIRKVLTEGIRQGGSSKTYVYRLPDGSMGNYQNHFLVYSQTGHPCKRCKSKIIRLVQNGRSTWMCDICQK